MHVTRETARKIISSIKKELIEKHSLYPKIGAELEFYIRSDNGAEEQVIGIAAQDCMRVEKEKGWKQYECVLKHTNDLEDLSENLRYLKSLISLESKQREARAYFDAKPFDDDYGSALHFHVSLDVDNYKNVLECAKPEDNPVMCKLIAGMLDLSEEFTYLLCKDEDDYKRFEPNFMAPTTISWGGNNRSTIIRIPDVKPEEKRIEFRLAPSSADPDTALMCLMIGIKNGLDNNLVLPERVFGNAHDEQYNLKPLPKSLDEAKMAFENGKNLAEYIKKIGG